MPKYEDGSGSRLEYVNAKFARALEIELNQRNEDTKNLMREARFWCDLAKRLAENGGGLGKYDALKYSDAIEEYKRSAQPSNEKS